MGQMADVAEAGIVDMSIPLAPKPTILSDPLLTARMLATLTGFSLRTIDRYRLDGKGPEVIHIGSSVRYKVSAVDLWLAQNSGIDQQTGACTCQR